MNAKKHDVSEALLASLLGVACGPGAVPWAAADTLTPAATWVVEPAAAGENLPAAGRLGDEKHPSSAARHAASALERTGSGGILDAQIATLASGQIARPANSAANR